MWRGEANLGTLYVIAILALVGVASFNFIGGVSVGNGPQNAKPVTIVTNIPQSGKSNLQLYTFGYTTPTVVLTPTSPPPPTGDSCHADAPKPKGSVCACPDHESVTCQMTSSQCKAEGGMSTNKFPGSFPGSQCTWLQGNPLFGSQYDKYIADPACEATCFGKPVIYLYPKVPTTVSVKLTMPGHVTISDPVYPENGWQDVLAMPSGQLFYQGKTYHELFYESAVSKNPIPPTGVVLATANLEQSLRGITAKLGLTPGEQQEFVDYWMPRLQALHRPYILFSVLTPEQKELVDRVDISPKPDTLIEFLAYFRPLDKPISIDPMSFPKVPERKGFTAVEWGGTVDK